MPVTKSRFTALFLSLLILVIIGIGCNKKTSVKSPGEQPSSKAEETIKLPETPSEIVNTYLKATLGGIPGANLEYPSYDSAKQHLVSELRNRFTTPAFVPQSYCIQDGPDNVKIESEEISGNMANVRVSAQYGAQFNAHFEDRWGFVLIIDKGEWKIKEIKCLNL